MDILKKRQEIRASMEQLMQKIKADMAHPDAPKYAYHSDMMNMYDYMMQEVDYLYKVLGSHFQGHLPPIKSTEQMSRAIEALGLDKEYEVEPRVIYAKDARGNLTATVTLKPKNA